MLNILLLGPAALTIGIAITIGVSQAPERPTTCIPYFSPCAQDTRSVNDFRRRIQRKHTEHK